MLEELSRETRTIILYEAPHHLKRTLTELLKELGERRITLCRELTKRFETVFPACGSSSSAIELTIGELEEYSGFASWVDVCKGWRD